MVYSDSGSGAPRTNESSVLEHCSASLGQLYSCYMSNCEWGRCHLDTING